MPAGLQEGSGEVFEEGAVEPEQCQEGRVQLQQHQDQYGQEVVAAHSRQAEVGGSCSSG